jgi:type I restriction enzyme R subunit
MDEDPAFYEKFSKLIQQAIDDFKARRISDLDYLNKVSDIRDSVVSKKHDDVPESISGNDEACAYYGVIKPYFMKYEAETQEIESVSAETSLAIQRIIEDHWKVDFWTDDDAQKSAINDIDDFLYDEVKDKFDMALSLEQMDEIIEKTMQIAKSRRHA